MKMPKLQTTIVTSLRKATLDMGDAESLEEFTDAMREAARQAHPEADWIWVAQIEPRMVVVSVETSSSSSYMQHDWSIEDGKPKLSAEATEVEPEVEYRPKRG